MRCVNACFSGAISVSKPSLEWVLSREGTGNAIAIMIGGAQEALGAHPGSTTLKIQSRKGFCRLALKHGLVYFPRPETCFYFSPKKLFFLLFPKKHCF